jgi:hypothetical protein
LITGVLGSFADVARYSLLIFATVAVNRHVDIARWTGTRMAKQVAGIMEAVLVLFLLAVLSA